MKFIKLLLSIPYVLLVAWLLKLVFIWLIPIAMNISWGWLIVYLLIAGGLVPMVIGAIVSALSIPNFWLTNENKLAKFFSSVIYGVVGISTSIIPWANGISSFGVLRWIVAISLTLLILYSYGSLIGSMYLKTGEDGESVAAV